MLSDAPNAPSTESNLHKEHHLEFYLHVLHTVEVVLRPMEVFVLEPIPTADNLHKSLR